MRNHYLALLLCLAVANGCLAQTNATRPTNVEGLSASKVQKIEAEINAWLGQTKAPALSVAIVTDNTLRWSKGFGLADLENSVPAKSDTEYRLASITKTMTAIALMQLVERRLIELNEPINRYCPAYPLKQALKEAPDKQFSITVRQLLIHQAGVRHNKPEEILQTAHFNSINEVVATFKNDPLVVEPGTKYSYSTPGYTLLGCAIETASGMSYIDYLREHVFKPAGMTRTFVDDVYAIIPNRARGYRKTISGEIQNAPLHDTSIKIPGGGLVTTVDDLAKFAIAVNKFKLVKPQTLMEMATKPTAEGRPQDYAMGFLVGEKDGVLRVFNDGSQAGTRSFIFLVPKEGFAVALMTNLERAQCEELVPTIRRILSEN